MKQINKNEIVYNLFSIPYYPDETRRKERAFSYTLALTALNDVGAGADENLTSIRTIIAEIKRICIEETGYEIDNNNKLVGSDYQGWKKNPYKNQPSRWQITEVN